MMSLGRALSWNPLTSTPLLPDAWGPEHWIPTGVPGLELPRGAITEVVGTASSGRTSLVCQVLAEVTRNSGACAVVDTANAFDQASAIAAGVDERFLLLVRCRKTKRDALKVVDWLLQGGGFSLIILDLESPLDVSLSAWFRFRRALENRPTAFLVATPDSCVGSSVSLRLKMQRRSVDWHGLLLKGSTFEAVPLKPLGKAGVVFEAKTCLLA